MAVKIRLKRMGSKKRPYYRVVVADARAPRDGRFIEEIGFYNPISEPKACKIDKERVDYWIGVGAKPTDTVNYLLKTYKIREEEATKKVSKSETESTEE